MRGQSTPTKLVNSLFSLFFTLLCGVLIFNIALRHTTDTNVTNPLPVQFANYTSTTTPTSPLQNNDVIHSENKASMLFVGDIMLGRYVEKLTDTYGISYPFLQLSDYIASFNISIANFESAVPRVHTPTPSQTMRFSTKRKDMEYLSDIGFDIVSLANNHAFDFGDEGLRDTRDACNEASLRCIGDPRNVLFNDSWIIEKNHIRIGIVPVHAVWGVSTEEITVALAEISKVTDIQFVYIHWGDEYILTHSRQQQTLAHTLIDAGADAIIGHHPHVVQDIEIYKNAPIFYSLGNFVFDQYFSQDVQQGIAVEFKITDSVVTYTIVGLESETMKSQPRLMEKEKYDFLCKRIMCDDGEYDILQKNN